MEKVKVHCAVRFASIIHKYAIDANGIQCQLPCIHTRPLKRSMGLFYIMHMLIIKSQLTMHYLHHRHLIQRSCPLCPHDLTIESMHSVQGTCRDPVLGLN